MRAALRILALLAGLLPLALVGACGEGADPGASPHDRVRLWTLTSAELVETPAAPAREVFVARFEDPEQGWSPVARPSRGPAELEVRTGTDGAVPYLRLAGKFGGLNSIVAVEPDTCYVFSGRVRTDGLEYVEDAGGGATFWLGEARGPGTLAEIVGERTDLLAVTHPLRGTRGTTDWTEHRFAFVTSSETRWLHVVCSLADGQTVRAGSADYAGVRLEQGSPRTFWDDALVRETAKRRDVEPQGADWQRARRVSAQLGQENRPSFVLLPGETLRFRLPPLTRASDGRPPRLHLGAGPWRPAMTAPVGGEITLHVACDGRELATRTIAVPVREADAFWEHVELELGPEARVLELRSTGSTPLVVGGAQVRVDVPRADGPNVLLVSIDTLRADFVGAYARSGGQDHAAVLPGRTDTPTLDRLARTGVLCRDASAVSPYTLPSHTTILTGQLPSVHGVTDHGLALSAARSVSLAEVLAAAGFATQAFTSGGFVNAEFGLDRGFDGFAQIDPVREIGSHYYRNLQRRGGSPLASLAERQLEEHGNAAVKRWLRDHADERFFLFLHTYTVHDYDAPASYLRCAELGCTRPSVTLSTRNAEEAAAYTPEMRAHIVHLYEAALRYTDDRLAEILAVLDETGQGTNTLVVVTSDHGEEFFERGSLQHGRTLYEELLSVPLILWGAGLEPRVIERPASLADVAPTILARLGLAPLANAQGVDLCGPAWPERYVWAEVDDRFTHLYALRTESGRKTLHFPGTPDLIYPPAREWEQFDLERDPEEQRDLADTEAADADMQDALGRYRAALEELGRRLGSVAHVGTDEATMRELADLGYGGLEK